MKEKLYIFPCGSPTSIVVGKEKKTILRDLCELFGINFEGGQNVLVGVG